MGSSTINDISVTENRLSEGDRHKHNGAQPANGAAKTSEPSHVGEKGVRVEEQINNEHLRRIERMFHEADTDGGGGLDMEEFREAMTKIMGVVEEEDVDILFMKVDTNCDGTVDWDEYLNYMLLEYREKDSLQKQNRPLYFPKPLKVVPVAHCEPIVRIQFHPYQAPQADKKVGEEGAVPKTRMQLGRYLTVSRDGILNYYSERFKLTRTINLEHLKRTKLTSPSQKIWVTDMICLSNLNLLALASTGRDVEFFDISANKCDIVFSLTGLEGYVVVMDYWTDGTKGVFSLGDVDGAISVFISHNVLQNGLFNSGVIKSIKPGGRTRLAFPALLKNTSKYFLCFKVTLHSTWCHQIRFFPELNVVATCCASDQTAMVLTSIPHSHKAKVYNTAFQLRKGILCFDYSADFNIIVTGGFDRIVRVWNPYVTNCATCQMKGHSTAVTHISVNSELNKIISISKDKNVRVWDLQDCACLQNIHSRNMPLGRFPIFSVHYNQDTHTLVMGTFLLGVLHGVVDDVDTLEQYNLKTSHEHPLCTAVYNSNFKQVVSGCHNGIVSVWDILTGEKVMQFQTSPEKSAEVTAMSIDGNKRRLITGSKDGVIRLWNYNNGALLLTLPVLHENEVTGILYINQRIYVSGWSKKVMWYLDVKEDMEMEYRVWNQYHTEDIYSMDAHGNKMLVTASYSGDIIVWNIDSGRAFCRFNASESPRPLMPKRVIADSSSFEAYEACESCPSLLSRNDEEDNMEGPEGFSETHLHNPSPQAGQSSTSQIEIPQEFKKDVENKSTKSPGPNPKERKAKPEPIGDEELEKPRLAVEKALFLGTRERSLDTAILLTSAADGHIYAWSIHHQGGLLGKFKAVHGEDVSISSMSTDLQDQMLLTGDSKGYIMLWDIGKYCYCMQGGQEAPAQQKGTIKLHSLIPKYCKLDGPRKIVPQDVTEEVIDGWAISLVPPRLLSSWRGHVKSVVSLDYVERFRLIVTASLDCNVRVWTIKGGYVGTFGQATWCVRDRKDFPSDVPIDLRRVGSSQTLKVLNQGMRPHWNYARRILYALNLQRKQASSMSSAADHLPELVGSDPRITNYTDEQIEVTWDKWALKGKQKSCILGESYKQKVRHYLPTFPPNLQSTYSSREQLRVYKAMHMKSLLPIIQPPVPDLLKEQLQKTQEGADATKQVKPKRRTPMRFLAASNAVVKRHRIVSQIQRK